MRANSFGSNITITTFGESHGPAVGVVVDGLKPGIPIDLDFITSELERRRPGRGAHASTRQEGDTPHILSGVFEGKTLGTPLAIVIYNSDTQSQDYTQLADIFRPGHGDWSWSKRYGLRDWRGGGRSSGRESAARVAAGAIAKSIIGQRGITITGYTVAIGTIRAAIRDMAAVSISPYDFCDPAQEAAVEELLSAARSAKDSIGAVVELHCGGIPAGLGDPVFNKLEARLAGALHSVGAVKGVEFGSGFGAAALLGSENNDAMGIEGFYSNNAGGVLGGISTGQDLVIRVAVKPTPSIGAPQETITGEGVPTTISIGGRHDLLLVPRIIPVLEAMAACILLDAILDLDALHAEPDSIASHRRAIDKMDEALMATLAARLDTARAIGVLKRSTGQAVTDLSREEALRLRREAVAKELGLDVALVETLFKSIIAASKRVQCDE